MSVRQQPQSSAALGDRFAAEIATLAKLEPGASAAIAQTLGNSLEGGAHYPTEPEAVAASLADWFQSEKMITQDNRPHCVEVIAAAIVELRAEPNVRGTMFGIKDTQVRQAVSSLFRQR